MATWLSHVTIAAPRNATASHTVTPSTGTVVAGTLFTPTAGRFLVVCVEGAVTSTTPSGWTLGSSAINNTGAYVWYRTAAGSDSLTTTHNGSNYPVVFDFYEFAAGTTWSGSIGAVNISTSGYSPILTGLTGTNWAAGVCAGTWSNGTGTPSVTTSTGVEAVDTGTPFTTTDGYIYSLAYLEDTVLTSVSFTADVVTGGANTPSTERLTWAVKVASGAGVVNATIAMGSSSSLVVTPAVTRNATVPMVGTSTMGVSTTVASYTDSAWGYTNKTLNNPPITANVPMISTSAMMVGITYIVVSGPVPMAGTSTMGVTATTFSIQTATVPMAGTSAMGVTPTVDHSVAVPMASTSSMGIGPLVEHPATAPMVSTSTMGVTATVTAANVQTATVPMTGTSAMGVAPTVLRLGTVPMVGTSAMAVTATVTGPNVQAADVPMVGTSTMGVVAAVEHPVGVPIVGTSAMGVVATVEGPNVQTAVVPIVGTSTLEIVPTGDVVGVLGFAGTSVVTVTATVTSNITALVPMVGTSAMGVLARTIAFGGTEDTDVPITGGVTYQLLSGGCAYPQHLQGGITYNSTELVGAWRY